MPPFLALILWFVLLVALFWWDPAKESGVSVALWVPVIWMFIMGSRLPSQWLGVQVGSQVQAMEEGNPIDRTIFFGLMLARAWHPDIAILQMGYLLCAQPCFDGISSFRADQRRLV